jgi:hypothetical protein
MYAVPTGLGLSVLGESACVYMNIPAQAKLGRATLTREEKSRRWRLNFAQTAFEKAALAFICGQGEGAPIAFCGCFV